MLDSIIIPYIYIYGKFVQISRNRPLNREKVQDWDEGVCTARERHIRNFPLGFCLRFATRSEGRKEGRKRAISLGGKEGIAQGVLPRCVYKLDTVYMGGEARRATWRRWRLPLPSSIMRTMTNRGSKGRAASVASERASERLLALLPPRSLLFLSPSREPSRGFSLPVRYVGSAPSLPPHLLTFKR